MIPAYRYSFPLVDGEQYLIFSFMCCHLLSPATKSLRISELQCVR